MKPMKIALGFIALVIIAIGIDGFRGRTITYRWDYDYAQYPPCAANLDGDRPEKPCLAGFSVFLDGIEKRRDKQFVPNRFDARGNITRQEITAVVHTRAYGNTEFCVTAWAKDEQGIIAESVPTCTRRRLLPFGVGN